jgi:hypothetical protein
MYFVLHYPRPINLLHIDVHVYAGTAFAGRGPGHEFDCANLIKNMSRHSQVFLCVITMVRPN